MQQISRVSTFILINWPLWCTVIKQADHWWLCVCVCSLCYSHFNFARSYVACVRDFPGFSCSVWCVVVHRRATKVKWIRRKKEKMCRRLPKANISFPLLKLKLMGSLWVLICAPLYFLFLLHSFCCLHTDAIEELLQVLSGNIKNKKTNVPLAVRTLL